MKKILISLLVFISFAACQKLDQLNKNTKDASSVPGEALFNGATRALLDQLFTFNVNDNNTELFAQHFAETTYPNESDYDMVTRPIPATHMNIMYRNVLMNYKEAARVLKATPLVGMSQQQRDNELAINEIMAVYAWSNVVETYGNVPYTEALDYTKPNPKYDDGLTIYKNLISRLNAAIAKLDPNYGGMGAGYDNVFGGGVDGTAKWIKFANTLKLRMGLMLSDLDATYAKNIIESAAPNVFSDPITSHTTGDKFAVAFLPDSPNQNPVYTEIVGSGRSDYVVTSNLVNAMNTLNDPRRDGYMWTKVGGVTGVYKGGKQGASNSYNAYTHVDNLRLTPTSEVVLMDYTEVEFLLAEAVERGFNVGGTAETHYNNAIKSSIKYWGGSDADAAAYLAQPAVAYTTASGTWREKIGTQAWYAYYFRGFTAWTSWRRLDYPRLIAPQKHVPAVNGVPVRYTYAVSEQTLNSTNYNAAATAIGGDRADTRLFWDKGPENYDSSFK
ncbi:MAG: SusD/RagB family nutrient-binding outer membrane lipoprotein [Bacteroidota bacterium]|nr:SusD/RagB family nutrient-binding outer membrane lipoprotein [Bacteroidota bacterium]